MRKGGFSILFVLVLLMALSLIFLIPSGAVTEEAEEYYDELLMEDSGEEEYGAKHKPIAVIASAVFSDILPSSGIDPLPIELGVPGNAPIEANFTENGYRDESMIVEIEQRRMYDSDVYIAYIKVATPSQLRTAIAGNKLSSERTNFTTAIASNYNAVVAMNGDFYSMVATGYITRMGTEGREKPSKTMDLLWIDELGDFHIVPNGQDGQKQAMKEFKAEHELINSFAFGPGLVVDGEKVEMRDNLWEHGSYDEPRAGIGQLDMLTYCLVVVNGREENTEGVTIEEFADIMYQLGCKQAYNLDGGNSATLVFNGKIVNEKQADERKVLDIIYFASAADGE
ncbi:MAG: phosphodiester glycosidase family protein [Clostridiales bacterium]|nr:phosphodiester glycosidase family protein [Clostridiales bacterium]